MKDAESAVERVLAGLGAAEAPEGMERRVLERVRQAELGSDRARRGGLMGRAGVTGRSGMTGAALGTAPALRSVWAVAGARRWAAAAVLVVTGLSWWAVRDRGREAKPTEQRAEVVRTEAAPKVRVTPPAAGRVEAVRGARAEGAGRLRAVQGAREGGAERMKTVRAARVMRVGMENHPPPELPLTEQERLLLRIARRGEPEEVAALNPELRAAQNAEEKAQFRQFFGPPAHGDDE